MCSISRRCHFILGENLRTCRKIISSISILFALILLVELVVFFDPCVALREANTIKLPFYWLIVELFVCIYGGLEHWLGIEASSYFLVFHEVVLGEKVLIYGMSFYLLLIRASVERIVLVVALSCSAPVITKLSRELLVSIFCSPVDRAFACSWMLITSWFE